MCAKKLIICVYGEGCDIEYPTEGKADQCVDPHDGGGAELFFVRLVLLEAPNLCRQLTTVSLQSQRKKLAFFV